MKTENTFEMVLGKIASLDSAVFPFSRDIRNPSMVFAEISPRQSPFDSGALP